MNGALAEFQDAFAQALFDRGETAGSALAAVAAQPGFAVYRNTVIKGCIDALQANYPAVARLVGDEWFRAAAAEFVRGHLPEHPALLYYSAGFADFLRGFAPAGELPYLADVAHLDRFWTEAHAARDAAALLPDALSGLAPEALAGSVLEPHPAARWAFFAGQPVYSIWRCNRERADGEGELDWQGEGALLTRPAGVVRWRPLDAAACAFLDACARGARLETAAAAALAVNADADLGSLVASLLAAGAFAGSGKTPLNLKELR
ncbi:MAG: putative DNA-binding domain-containing protein [Burkholderiales bacterium]|nr:putative DNA-binding domain-containing protein [Burkholderiales bacterium]